MTDRDSLSYQWR